MIETGVLREDDRVELLEGWVLSKMTHNPPHDSTVWLVQTALLPRLPSGWILRTQSAVTLSDSEPEPDVVVAEGPGTRYASAHPKPRDLALVVEVADTSLAEDRQLKGRAYARARIPIYWIVNILERQVEVYTGPRAGKAPAYRQRQDYGQEDEVPQKIGGQDIGPVPVRELLLPG
jgi:Uma2 family endonuclease